VKFENRVCATPLGSKPRRCTQEEKRSTGTRSGNRALPLPVQEIGLTSASGKRLAKIAVLSVFGCRHRISEMRSWGRSILRCCAWLARGVRTRSCHVVHAPCRHLVFPRWSILSRLVRVFWQSFAAAFVLSGSMVTAADLGTHGPLYDVEEPSLLDTIYARLSEMEESGELDQMKSEQQQRTRDYVKRPRPVAGLIRATEPALWDVDLSITVQEDIADHQGVVFARAGTVVNPLAFSSFNKRIVLFDGDDAGQLEYALSKGDELDTLLVLINGDPLGLMREHGRRFYFDQQSVLTDRFGVRHVPAEITRGTHVMHVREIVLEDQQ